MVGRVYHKYDEGVRYDTSPALARAASTRAHRRDTLPGVLSLALLPAKVAVGRDRPALAPDDRFALPAGRAFNAPFFDRHDLAQMLR